MKSESSSTNSLRMAWIVVGLLFPVALLNYLDRQMIAVMKTSVMADVTGITQDTQWGYMLGQFKWCYALFSPIGGWLADRFSRRWTICASLIAWSVVTCLTGQVTSYDGLLWTRTMMGISEAFYIPAALALIADYHQGSTRSRAVGIHQMGIYAGLIIGGFAGFAADAPWIGWRRTFQVVGLLGIVYAVPLGWVLRDPLWRDESGLSRNSGEVVTRPSWLANLRDLFANPSFLLLVAYFTLPALAGWVVRDWMPAILKDTFAIGQGWAGVSATVYWQMAAIVAAILGGWWADRWSRKTERGRIYVSAIGTAMIIPALLGVGLATEQRSLALAVLALVVFGLGWGLFDCNNMPILCQIVDRRARATGYGMMNMVSISCGGLADWGFGWMRDRGVTLNAIFAVFAICCVLSVILVLLIRPRSPLESPWVKHS
jgi:MFS family permease